MPASFINYRITYDGTNIEYYINNVLIQITEKLTRTKLYVAIYFSDIETTAYNLRFGNAKEYYHGYNGLEYKGLVGSDTYTDLSGSVIINGTSQGASEEGRYSIIPSGLTSNNYNIKFVNGYLNIKKSILS
jgi:hypothetical protein